MIKLTARGVSSVVWLVLLLVGCSVTPPLPEDTPRSVKPVKEPPSATGNPRSYVVFGKRYQVRMTSRGYRERGLASWYGPKFHGRNTSSGTPFDMYAISAAHKSLPIPTYVRVTHLGNSRSLVVRVDDRGPFVEGRIIDLSYGAAVALGMVDDGTAPVEVVALPPYQFLPDFEPERDGRLVADNNPQTPPAPAFSSEPSTAGSMASSQRPVTPLAPAHGAPAEPPSSFSPRQTMPLAYSVPPVTAATPADTVPAYSLPQPATSLATANTSLYLQVGAFANRYNAERLRQRLVGFIEDEVHIDTRTEQLYRVRIGPLQDPGRAERLKTQLADLGLTAHQVVFE